MSYRNRLDGTNRKNGEEQSIYPEIANRIVQNKLLFKNRTRVTAGDMTIFDFVLLKVFINEENVSF